MDTRSIMAYTQLETGVQGHLCVEEVQQFKDHCDCTQILMLTIKFGLPLDCYAKMAAVCNPD